MQNLVFRVFTCALLLAACGLVASAQTPKRIDFVKEGSPSLVWEEKVAANSSKSFVFYAKKGQKLTLNFIDDTNQGSMDLGKVSIEPNGDGLEMVIEVSKDYTFTVSNNSNKATSFRIFITLEDASTTGGASTSDGDEAAGERVKFAAGETSTYLERNIPANDSHEFIINAKKGQTIGFTIGYDFKDSDITVYLGEPGDQDNAIPSAPKAPQTFVVKKSGDHRLEVTNTTRKKITITLYLDIEPTGASAANSPGDADAEQVQFPQGATDVSLERTVKANSSYDFILNIRKGQRMVFSFEGGKTLEMFLTEPGFQDISVTSGPNEPNEFVVKKAGDHRITINNQSGKPAKFPSGVFIE